MQLLNGGLNDEWSVATDDDSCNDAWPIKIFPDFSIFQFKKASRRIGMPRFNDCLPYEKMSIKIFIRLINLNRERLYWRLFSLIIVFEMRNEVLCHMFLDRRAHLHNDRRCQLQEAVVQNNPCSTSFCSRQKE